MRGEPVPQISINHYESTSVTDGATVGNRTLLTVRWCEGGPVGDGYILGEFQRLNAVVADPIDCDVFSPDEGNEYVNGWLCAWTGECEELLIRTPGKRSSGGRTHRFGRTDTVQAKQDRSRWRL